MFYAVFVPLSLESYSNGDMPTPESLIFTDIKKASITLKKYSGSRMKMFKTRDEALDFIDKPSHRDESFIEEQSSQDLSESLEKLSIKADVEQFPSAKPVLLNQLRRDIEAGAYEKVEETIWSNPRTLITVSDSAVYLMAGPKYNACHIAARANKPDMMALILDTVSNMKFARKLYPDEPDQNIQDRVNHLIDSYLNTPDPRQGNTPLHFACRLGYYRVVRVLLTFEGCDTNLRNLAGQTAEECICAQKPDESGEVSKKIKEMLKLKPHLPLHRDQLKKRLILAKRINQAGELDSDISFSDDSFIVSPQKTKGK